MIQNDLLNGGKQIECCSCGKTSPIPEGSDTPTGWERCVDIVTSESGTKEFIYYECEQCNGTFFEIFLHPISG